MSEEIEEKKSDPTLAIPDSAAPEYIPSAENKGEKRKGPSADKRDAERPKRSKNFLVFNILFVMFVGGCLFVLWAINLSFPVIAPEEVAKRHFESPQVSEMEHLSGVGWSFMQAREQKVRFISHQPVRLRNAKDFKFLTASDPGFKYCLDDIIYAFPEEKTHLLGNLNSLEMWRRDPVTLVHDKSTDLYLFLNDD